jgi:1,2-diacylglycerol 3-alpha-glucosyltransferase
LSLRIAIAIDPWLEPFNGAVVSTRRFVSALADRGHRIDVLAIGGEESTTGDHTLTPFSRLSLPGFNRIIDTMRAPLAKPDRARLREVLRECDLLHVQFPFWLGYAALNEAGEMDVPVVTSFHVQPENILSNIDLDRAGLNGLLYRFFVSRFFNRSTAVLAPSQFAADLLARHGVNKPVSVISNGVPRIFFDVRRGPSRDGRIRLLSIGRLAREKHQETLLLAVSKSARRADIEVALAGAGPREFELRRLAASLGLNAKIGPVSDAELMSLYARADLFVHCGAAELEGMSVLEAMAVGLPVIVADARESACAHMPILDLPKFEPGNANDLSQKIDKLLSSPDRLSALGHSNRGYAEQFRHEKSVEQLERLYNNVATPMQIALDRGRLARN